MPGRRRRLPPALLATLLAAFAAASTADAPKADWNEAAIDWLGLEEGLDRIRTTDRPGVLVFYTDWCPHCTRYSGVFHAREVVELAREFVMIRVDHDAAEGIDPAYAERGSYVPRTLFVSPSGRVDWSAAGAHPRYPHFLDTTDPGELVSLMRRFRAAQASVPAAPAQGATASGASKP